MRSFLRRSDRCSSFLSLKVEVVIEVLERDHVLFKGVFVLDNRHRSARYPSKGTLGVRRATGVAKNRSTETAGCPKLDKVVISTDPPDVCPEN